jgi:hypothetical protein
MVPDARPLSGFAGQPRRIGRLSRVGDVGATHYCCGILRSDMMPSDEPGSTTPRPRTRASNLRCQLGNWVHTGDEPGSGAIDRPRRKVLAA